MKLNINLTLYLKILILLTVTIVPGKALSLENCKWDNRKGIPCVIIKPTPNTSAYSSQTVKKEIITKQEIINSGAIDIKDVLKTIPGLDIFQSGPMGQQTSMFTRGSESNHTLVLLNGMPINDQSVTDGLFDFGQDFIQTIQQIEIYKGANGAHFGPSAIAGAVNFITAIDYKNSITMSGFNGKNNSIDGNYTKITNNGWHLNFKGSATQSKTNSALSDGAEKDDADNIQVNLNTTKWLDNNTKLTSTLYSRKTNADYDGSSTDESGYVANNIMYALQTGLDRVSKNKQDSLMLHYHNYDREYENSGYLDEYDSETLTIRGERKIRSTSKFSFGYGSEYKYDWGSFENRGSYNASTKGHVKDFGIFGNFGYKLSENAVLSLYSRSDDHNVTGRNETYKINLEKIINKFKFGLTHSTGLRNPTLYEFYGTDNYGIKGNKDLNPEKSKTNEMSGEYKITNGISFKMTAYRAKIFDQIETNAGYTKHENELINLNQEGLESKFAYKNNNKNFSVFSNFSKSEKTNGQTQNRRPEITFGSNYIQSFKNSFIGPFNFNISYRYTGKYNDWTGSKNEFVKSTDLVDFSISKNVFGNIFSLKMTNLLNEKYERPATYSQDGRQIRLGFKKNY